MQFHSRGLAHSRRLLSWPIVAWDVVQLREYVEDTEDYINIMLDEKQNNLLQMNILVQAATLSITFFLVATTIFAMNIPYHIFDPDDPANWVIFPAIMGTSSVTTVLVFISLILYMWSRDLIGGKAR